MLVWKGWGILTPIILVVGSLLGGSLRSSSLGVIGAAFGLLLAPLVNWFVGQHFNRPLREAGLGSGRRHTFFWIPMELWSFIYLAGVTIAIGMAVFAK